MFKIICQFSLSYEIWHDGSLSSSGHGAVTMLSNEYKCNGGENGILDILHLHLPFRS